MRKTRFRPVLDGLETRVCLSTDLPPLDPYPLTPMSPVLVPWNPPVTPPTMILPVVPPPSPTGPLLT